MAYTSYARLKGSEDEPDNDTQYRDDPRFAPARNSKIWIILTIVFLSLNIIQFSMSSNDRTDGNHGTYEQGFSTDFTTALEAIELEERLFTGWISYNHTAHDVYRVTDPMEPQYFGPPSPDIDNAWRDLLYGQYPAMTDEEATVFITGYPVPASMSAFADENPKFFRGLNRDPTTRHYHMQLDIFHSLHCVNYIRKSLHPSYYDPPASHLDERKIRLPPSWPQVHLEHCLDHIRQSIQCHGDLSPAPFYAWKGLDLTIATGQKHVCRKYSRIREWQDKRNSEMMFMEDLD